MGRTGKIVYALSKTLVFMFAPMHGATHSHYLVLSLPIKGKGTETTVQQRQPIHLVVLLTYSH